MGDNKPSNDANPILSGSLITCESDPSKEIGLCTNDVSSSNIPTISTPEMAPTGTAINASMQFNDRSRHFKLADDPKRKPFTFPAFAFTEPTDSDSGDDDTPMPPPSMVLIKNDQEREKLKENSDKYLMLIASTEGFCAGKWKQSDLRTIYNGIGRWPNNSQNACLVAAYAVSFLNKEGEDEIKVKRIIRVNGQILDRLIYFLTLKASDNKYYEAKVYLGLDLQTKELGFIRPAKYFPKIPVNLQHLVGPDEGQSSCP